MNSESQMGQIQKITDNYQYTQSYAIQELALKYIHLNLWLLRSYKKKIKRM